jgi:hypothetical protein
MFYLYVLSKGEFEQKKTTRLKDSLTSVTTKLNDANYFSLEKNENAQNYFESGSGKKVIQYETYPFVTEKLLDLNANPRNPYRTRLEK